MIVTQPLATKFVYKNLNFYVREGVNKRKKFNTIFAYSYVSEHSIHVLMGLFLCPPIYIQHETKSSYFQFIYLISGLREIKFAVLTFTSKVILIMK